MAFLIRSPLFPILSKLGFQAIKIQLCTPGNHQTISHFGALKIQTVSLPNWPQALSLRQWNFLHSYSHFIFYPSQPFHVVRLTIATVNQSRPDLTPTMNTMTDAKIVHPLPYVAIVLALPSLQTFFRLTHHNSWHSKLFQVTFNHIFLSTFLLSGNRQD